MKIVAKDNSPLLGIGEHEVVIKQVFTDTAKPSPLYKDVTEQLAVLFEDASGKTITRWYNLKGYEINPKAPTRTDDRGREVPNYQIDKQGVRVENVANTEKAMRIIAGLAIHAGFDEETELDASDLVGCACNIMVQRDAKFNSNKVAYTMKASTVTEDEDAEIA